MAASSANSQLVQPTIRANQIQLQTRTQTPQETHHSLATPAQFNGHKSLQSNQQQQQQVAGPSQVADSSSGLDESVEDVARNRHFCPAQSGSRNLYWNLTLAGQVARQNCPDGSLGKASWFCDPERLRFAPVWSADFSQCRSSWLQRLANQLSQMLEAPSKQLASQSGQKEQTLRVVLNDLALMARTKQLFGEDLKRVDIMISQMIAQLKSVSVLFGGPASNWPGVNLASLHEELFTKLADIIASLFDRSQRSAWLELQPAELRRLEMRYLNHLRDSGLLLASSEPERTIQVRQSNLLAALTVIRGQSEQWQQLDTLNRFVTELDSQLNHFKIQQDLSPKGESRSVPFFLQSIIFANLQQLSNDHKQLPTC